MCGESRVSNRVLKKTAPAPSIQKMAPNRPSKNSTRTVRPKKFDYSAIFSFFPIISYNA